MSSANLTQRETAARAQAVELISQAVAVDVRDARDPGCATFPVSSTMQVRVLSDSWWIDFLGNVEQVLLDGQERPFQHDGARVSLPDVPLGEHEIVVQGRGFYSRSGEGLHRFVDPVDGETYLYTQYEPADARRVFANFEQPDIRAPFTFSLTGPEEWWLGSNQPEAARTQVADGVVRVDFQPTLPLSTYITCICAGPYHRVADTWTGQQGSIELGLLCRQSMKQYMDSEELFRVTKAGFDWFTTNFGAYPWGVKYDQIFVPEYNLGAMENPGLVTFTESYLFRAAPTPAQLQGRSNTVLHEMSHMWFGDLVVPQWWGDLWLKESFAEFMGSHVSVEAAGFDEGWVNFATNRKVGAYLTDAMPTTHPIVATIDDLEAAKTNFDRITYSKGASALTQLVHYVGLPAFLAGARRYFAQHPFASATLTDFIDALSQETDRDLRGWVASWLQTSGHDTLSVELNRDGERIRDLTLVREGSRPHATTVGAYRLGDAGLELLQRYDVVVEDDRTLVEAARGDVAPDVVLVNDLDYTFARVALDDASREVLLAHVGTLEPIARAVAWTALWGEVRAGSLKPADFVGAVLRADERQTGVLASLLDRALTAVAQYSTDATLMDAWQRGAYQQALTLPPGSAEQQLWARAFLVVAAASGGDVRGVLDGAIPGLELSPDITWLAWQALAARNDASDAELDAALAADDTAAGHIARLEAWASRPNVEIKREAWRRAHVVGGESNDAVDALLDGFNALGQSALRAEFAPEYFATLEDVWRSHPIEIAMRLVRAGFPRDGHEAGTQWLNAHADAPATLIRLVTEEVFEEELAARLRAQ